jgi:DNA-binding MarR family transcriptional regulator
MKEPFQKAGSPSLDRNIVDDRMAHLAKETVRQFSRNLQLRLAMHSVTTAQWLFLRVLWATDGLTQRELSEQVGLKDSTTHAGVVGLQKLGYVKRKTLPHNHRKVHVFLTATGQKLKRLLVPLAEEVNEIALCGLSKKDIATTRGCLAVMLENLLRDEEACFRRQQYIPSTHEISRIVNGQRPTRVNGRKLHRLRNSSDRRIAKSPLKARARTITSRSN